VTFATLPWRAILAGSLIGLAAALADAYDISGFLANNELKAINEQFSLRGPRTPHAPVVIVTIDEDGEILFVNSSAQRIFGYSGLDMLGRSLTLLVPGYSPAMTRSKYQAKEVAGRHKNGREIQLEVSFGEFTQASRTLATCVLRDISARRRAEEELRRANETLRALIEATPLAIVAFDFSENVSKWNSAAERMFGCFVCTKNTIKFLRTTTFRQTR